MRKRSWRSPPDLSQKRASKGNRPPKGAGFFYACPACTPKMLKVFCCCLLSGRRRPWAFHRRVSEILSCRTWPAKARKGSRRVRSARRVAAPVDNRFYWRYAGRGVDRQKDGCPVLQRRQNHQNRQNCVRSLRLAPATGRAGHPVPFARFRVPLREIGHRPGYLRLACRFMLISGFPSVRPAAPVA